MPCQNSSKIVLKNSFRLLLIFVSFSTYALEIKANTAISVKTITCTFLLEALPEIELFQALKDSFRSEIIIYARVMKKTGDRFPWIDELVEEKKSILTVWYDKPTRYYFLEDQSGRLLSLRTFKDVTKRIETEFLEFQGYPKAFEEISDYYLIYRAEIFPIRIAEPFQFFLFSPFFQNFSTPWERSQFETTPAWHP